jgi:hypothetical protein
LVLEERRQKTRPDGDIWFAVVTPKRESRKERRLDSFKGSFDFYWLWKQAFCFSSFDLLSKPLCLVFFLIHTFPTRICLKHTVPCGQGLSNQNYYSQLMITLILKGCYFCTLAYYSIQAHEVWKGQNDLTCLRRHLWESQIKISYIPTLYTMSKIIIIGKNSHRKMPQTHLRKNLLEIIKLFFFTSG